MRRYPSARLCGNSTDIARRCQIRRAALFRRGMALIALVLAPAAIGATDLYTRATEAFLENRPREAAPLFEQVIRQEPTRGSVYLYLALSYEQLAMHEQAIATLQRALSVPGIDRALVHLNMGNNLLRLGRRVEAEDAYTRSMEVNPRSAGPVLNRANTRLLMESFEAALEDYRATLELAPAHPQRVAIERMIALLQAHVEEERRIAELERQRLEEIERQRVLEEQRRLAEEARLREEAEARRRALLNNVLDSIRSAAEGTEHLSAGTEGLDDYDEDFDIAD